MSDCIFQGKSLSSGSQEAVRQSGQRWRQTRDQEYVDHMAGGMRLNREMRYNADTEEGYYRCILNLCKTDDNYRKVFMVCT